MKADGYWHRSGNGPIVHIGRSSKGWAIYLDHALICDGFRTPEDAAFHANRKDFDTEPENRLFARVWVPPELQQWKTSPPEEHYGVPNPNN
jgi:hypothetical protein